ncbi:pilus assembly protein [Paenibacillus sp. IB182496]|uniref:Pilus assembly protein n=1 Tax=Paenibacillus sabuli TaxID=2772509 RepID=A0A927BRQ4_9BACL|nr:TadE family protein [Paenibacillus sabuli]MBD2844324.1 pilus assembly protein [Paenibacillus sabuli]
MVNYRSVHWKFLRDERGSYSLEASLVLPFVFVAVLIMLLFAMYMYQRVTLYYVASTAAERTAYGWDNSKRSPLTGLPQPGESDGLYWRIGSDAMLDSLFGLGSGGAREALDLPLHAQQDGASLPARKLQPAASWIPASYEGDVAYERGVLQRTIHVRLRQPLRIAPLELMLGHSDPQAQAFSTVVDPVELIRSVDLVRYYTAKFSGSDSKSAREEAATILKRKRSSPGTGS